MRRGLALGPVFQPPLSSSLCPGHCCSPHLLSPRLQASCSPLQYQEGWAHVFSRIKMLSWPLFKDSVVQRSIKNSHGDEAAPDRRRPEVLTGRVSQEAWPKAGAAGPRAAGAAWMHSTIAVPALPGPTCCMQRAVAALRMPHCSKAPVRASPDHTVSLSARAGVAERWSILKGKWRIMQPSLPQASCTSWGGTERAGDPRLS